MTRERDLKAEILVRLSQLGCFAWNNPTGVARTLDGGRVVSFGVPGAPDVLVIVPPHGRLVAVECKAPNGRQGPAQVLWQHRCEQCGGIYVLARSVGDAESAILRARGEG